MGNGLRRFPTIALVIVAVLVLGLLGGLLHHHESESEAAACCYCHCGLQTPIFDLAIALVATSFAPVGFVTPSPPIRVPSVIHFFLVVPRAPPATAIPVAS